MKCGKHLPEVTTMERNPQFEIAVLKAAAERVGLPHLADSLHAFADRRVLDGPILLPPGRDLIQEWLEEAADGVGNYGPWYLQLQHLFPSEDDGTIAYIQEALQHGMLMYHCLLKAAGRQ
ncbi:MAG: hypothetical protein WCO96_01255 [Actinomycetes bacterium]